MNALYKINEKFKDSVLVSELRMVKSDQINMSLANGSEASIGIHFTWKKDVQNVFKILP
jgi:hypothetical protein